jgi:ABC-type siderophore export system fused ATPase/permease subunit
MAPARAAAAAAAAPVGVIASVAVVLQSENYDVSCLTFADAVLVACLISLIISVRGASLFNQNLVMGLPIIQRTDVLRLSAVRMV